MMDPFVRAICESPEDDTLRLVYADWLEENGQAARSEFIRVQCRIAELQRDCSCGGCVKKRGGGQHTNGPCDIDRDRQYKPFTLRVRERELLSEYGHVWAAPFAQAVGCCFDEDWRWDGRPFLLATPRGDIAFQFRRGFVEHVALPLADFCGGPCERCGGSGEWNRGEYLQNWEQCPDCYGAGRTAGHAAAIFAAQPITRVTLTDREPVQIGAVWNWMPGNPESPHFLGPDLYGLLDLPIALVGDMEMNAKCVASRELAHAALSAGCVLFGRAEARKLWEEERHVRERA